MQNSYSINTLRNVIASGALKSDTKRVSNTLAHEATAQVITTLIPHDAWARMNQKAILRTVQACDFIATGDALKSCDEVTSAMVAIIALANQSQVSFADAHLAAGASKEASPIKGVSRARLARFLPRTSNLGTITSKVSRTVGKAGLFTALGITVKGDTHSFILTDAAKSHPFIIAYALGLEQMTEGAFTLLQQQN